MGSTAVRMESQLHGNLTYISFYTKEPLEQYEHLPMQPVVADHDRLAIELSTRTATYATAPCDG